MEQPSFDAPAADWLVYGDALQEAGDPRGALIGLSIGIDEGKLDAAVRDAYVKEHADALLGHAAKFVDTFRWQWRFLPIAMTCRIGSNDGDSTLLVLDEAIATELRAITVVGHSDNRVPVSLEPAMTRLVRRRPAHLRAFTFVDERAANATSLISRDFEPNDNLVRLGSLQPFFPFAEELHLHVADSHQLDISPMDAPELRAFTLASLRFGEYDNADTMVRRLEDAALPKLERYAVRLTETWYANIPLEENAYLPVYSERYAELAVVDEEDGEEPGPNRYEEADFGDTQGVPWNDQFVDLLALLARSPLKQLALTGFTSSRSLVEVLDRAGLPATLETLDLSDSALDDSDAAWMAAHPARFAGLKRLIVERTHLTAAGAGILRGIGPEIVHSHADTLYRYIVGSE